MAIDNNGMLSQLMRDHLERRALDAIRQQPLKCKLNNEESKGMDDIKYYSILACEDITTIKCRYTKNGTTYTYLATKAFASALEVGDKVLVENGTKDIAMVEVVGIDEETEITKEYDYRFAFQFVNLDSLDSAKQKVSDIVVKVKAAQRQSIRDKARQMLAQGQLNTLIESD